MNRLKRLDFMLILFIQIYLVRGKQSCDYSDLTPNSNQCPPTQTCIPVDKNNQNGYCDCKPGFVLHNETYCKNVTHPIDIPTPKSSSLIKEESGNGHIVVGILIPVFLITIVICGVYLSRKYMLISYIRARIHQRNTNYDEVMIGQDLDEDDPPLR